MEILAIGIDPDNDFMDNPYAPMAVPGANADMDRMALFIERKIEEINELVIFIDGHKPVHVASGITWVDKRGKHPSHGTMIFYRDVESGLWTTTNPDWREKGLIYTRQLDAPGKYPLCIWNQHCLEGSVGQAIQDNLYNALKNWSEKNLKLVDYMYKPSDVWVEYLGGLVPEAEVKEPGVKHIDYVQRLLRKIRKADIVIFFGEASSHCFRITINQILARLGKEHYKKLVLFLDCTSPIPAIPNGPDFPAITNKWFMEMEKLGLTLTTSTQFLT